MLADMLTRLKKPVSCNKVKFPRHKTVDHLSAYEKP